MFGFVHSKDDLSHLSVQFCLIFCVYSTCKSYSTNICSYTQGFCCCNTLTLKVSCLLISGLIMQFHFFPLNSATCVCSVCAFSVVGYQKWYKDWLDMFSQLFQNLCGTLPDILSSFPLKLKLSFRFCGMSFNELLVKFLEEVWILVLSNKLKEGSKLDQEFWEGWARPCQVHLGQMCDLGDLGV